MKVRSRPGFNEFKAGDNFHTFPSELAPALPYSAASGAPMLPLLYIPERSKQQALRLPHASLSQAVTMRLPRVSAFLPEVIQWIQSRRATGVMSAHVAWASALDASA